jgi:hypothetical protein
MTTLSPAPARLADDAIHDAEAALGRQFGGVPAWFARATHAWCDRH